MVHPSLADVSEPALVPAAVATSCILGLLPNGTDLAATIVCLADRVCASLSAANDSSGMVVLSFGEGLPAEVFMASLSVGLFMAGEARPSRLALQAPEEGDEP